MFRLFCYTKFYQTGIILMFLACALKVFCLILQFGFERKFKKIKIFVDRGKCWCYNKPIKHVGILRIRFGGKL